MNVVEFGSQSHRGVSGKAEKVERALVKSSYLPFSWISFGRQIVASSCDGRVATCPALSRDVYKRYDIAKTRIAAK